MIVVFFTYINLVFSSLYSVEKNFNANKDIVVQCHIYGKEITHYFDTDLSNKNNLETKNFPYIEEKNNDKNNDVDLFEPWSFTLTYKPFISNETIDLVELNFNYQNEKEKDDTFEETYSFSNEKKLNKTIAFNDDNTAYCSVKTNQIRNRSNFLANNAISNYNLLIDYSRIGYMYFNNYRINKPSSNYNYGILLEDNINKHICSIEYSFNEEPYSQGLITDYFNVKSSYVYYHEKTKKYISVLSIENEGFKGNISCKSEDNFITIEKFTQILPDGILFNNTNNHSIADNNL